MKKSLFVRSRKIKSVILCLAAVFLFTTGCKQKKENKMELAKEQKAHQSVKAGNEEAIQALKEKFSAEKLFDENLAVKDTKTKNFSNKSVFEVTKEMTVGWNLGNTFDATASEKLDSETSWGQPYTTKEMIDGLVKSGIKTIRIPVSWHNHIINKSTYTIDPEWMARVKTVVDWAIDDGLYVIINAHHDNADNSYKMRQAAGYYPNDINLVESQRYLYNVWSQISLAFNNGYDEHLIFETMNEPRPAGTPCEWWFNSDSRCLESAKCLNIMNQTALDAIRNSGGNNKKRFVMCPPLQASENSASSPFFKMPEDDEPGKLILSVHAYTPYSFAMEAPGETVFTENHKTELNALFRNLQKNFIDKGYPVIIGEYGATNKDNIEERVKWFDYFLTSAHSLGITCVLWDNGVWALKNDASGKPDYSEGYGYYNRTEQKWYFPEIIETLVKTTK